MLAVGSLTVQIFGSSSPGGSNEDEERNKKVGRLMVSNKQNGFSTSPVPISSSKDLINTLKK